MPNNNETQQNIDEFTGNQDGKNQDQNALAGNRIVVEKLGNEIQITATSTNECGITGLRFVNDSFRKELLNFTEERLINRKRSLLLYAIDLRNLKKLNDDLGHDGANVAIKSYVKNVRAELSTRIEGSDAEFVFYRPQSGGDEFYILIAGEDDLLHKLEEELPDVLSETVCDGEDRDKRLVKVPVGGEFGAGLLDAKTPIEEQILALQLQLKLPSELAFDPAKADNFAKISHLYELIKEHANRILDEKKFANLVQEIVAADDIFQEILVQIEDPQQDRNPEEGYAQARKIVEVFQKLEHKLAITFGSRRLTPMGALYIFQLGGRLGVIKYKLDMQQPLSISDKVLLGIMTPLQADLAEQMARSAIIGAKGNRKLQNQIAQDTF